MQLVLIAVMAGVFYFVLIRPQQQKVKEHRDLVASLEVGDDFDLVVRTYLAGVEFAYIPECLYVYRLQEGGSNTYLLRNAEIQRVQQELSNKYFYHLVEEWARRERLPKADFGGATGCPAGYAPIDLQNGHDVFEWMQALEDSSVGVIRAHDFLEHIPSGRVVELMNEIHRVLVPGGWLLSSTPSTDGRGAFQDPTHVTFWNQNSFWYYTRRQQAQYVPAIAARFQATRVWTDFPNDWCKQHNIAYVHADLCALKGQRQPGICEI